jgi:hypothetical protein
VSTGGCTWAKQTQTDGKTQQEQLELSMYSSYLNRCRQTEKLYTCKNERMRKDRTKPTSARATRAEGTNGECIVYKAHKGHSLTHGPQSPKNSLLSPKPSVMHTPRMDWRIAIGEAHECACTWSWRGSLT